jgi:cysteine desulfurase/selenocysteine lyase
MDPYRLRKDFPVLVGASDDRPLVYLDSACQTLRPISVVDAVREYYESCPACAGRSSHRLATEVSVRCDDVRLKAAGYFGARDPSGIAFLKNATEGLNTVIFGSGLAKGDEVVTTDYEHNSVHVPLVVARERLGIKRRTVPSENGVLDMEAFAEAMSRKVKLVVMCMTSNVTGYTLPAKDVVDIAHSYGAEVMFDAAQTAPSIGIDVETLGVDYLVASAHKMLGPSGVGMMYARHEAGVRLRPLSYGGHGVTGATASGFELLPPPERFEAGLQNYAGIFGTGAALDYLSEVGLDEVREHERSLNERLTRALACVPKVEVLGPPDPGLRGGILSFNVDGLTPHDIAMILDNSRGVMVRAGMHCCHSYFESIGIDGCVRASAYLYNTTEDIDVLADAVNDVADRF